MHQPREAHFLFTRMASHTELSPKHRCWNGNDRTQRNHNGAVPLDENPFDIQLCWKASPRAPVHEVGCFRLNLSALLAAGYIRPDRKVNHVRLRFFHHHDNGIYIEARPGGPCLLIGKVC